MAATDFEVTVNTKDFDQSIRRIIAEMKEVDKTSKDTGNSIDAMGKKIAGAAAAYFSVQQAQQFLNKVIEIRGQFQQLDIAFTTMLQGNKEASSKLMNELTEFASMTPFGLMDAASGAKQLLAYGFAVDNVVKDMEMLGNVASGVSAPLNDIVYLYGTLKASGRVATMDIRQFAGRGIPIYRELAKVMGVAEGEINDLVSAGKVGFNDIEKAFKRMTGEGGTFYNLMREQSKSLPGQISNLEDSIDMMFNEIGAASEEYISKGIEGVAWLVENYEKVGRTLLELVGAYGAYKVALVSVKALTSGMTAVELAHMAAIVAKEKAQKLLNATMLKNPYVLAAAGVAVLAYGIYKLATAQSDVEELQKELNKSFAQSQVEAAKEIAELDRLKGALQGCKKDTDEYKRIKEEIVNKFGKYDDTLKAEILSVQTLTDKYDALTKKVKESTNERMYNNWLATNQENYNKKETKYLDEIYKALEKNTQSPEKASELYQQLLGAIYKGYNPADRNAGYTKLYKALYNAGVNDEANLLAIMFRENEKLKKHAQQRFGITKSGSTSQTSGEATVTAEKANKKFWEEKKKAAEAEFEALATYELNTQKANDIRARIAKADAKIALYDTKSESAHKTTKANLSANYAREMAKQVADAQLEIRQASIDAMNEGFAKENAQLELNYHKQLQEITNMESEMVEKLRDYEQKKWEQANPEAKKQGKVFDRSRVTVENLSDDQKAIVNEMYSQANSDYMKNSVELTQNLLTQWRTYEEQRLAISEHYEKVRNDVRKTGGTEANIAEVNRKEQEELSAIDEQFAMRSTEYEEWCNQIANLTLTQLIALLNKAESELQKAEAKGEDLAQLRAKKKTLEDAIKGKEANSKAQDEVSPNKRSIGEWNELQEAIQQSINALNNLGDTMGDTAGKAIKTAGSFATSTLSLIGSISSLVEMASSGTVETATAAGRAIEIVERASIILTIISLSFEIASRIASLFSDQEDEEEKASRLSAEMSRLEWELNNPEALKMMEKRGSALENINKLLAQNIKLSIQAGGTWNYLKNVTKAYERTVKQVANSYKNLSYSEATVMTEEKYKNVGKDLENIAQQQMLLVRQNQQLQNVDKDESVDWSAIQANKEKIEELQLQAAQLMNDYVDEIVGGSAQEIATKLGDAFWEAAKEGKDAMKELKGEVDDIVGDIVKRMLIANLLEPKITELFDKKKAEWFNDGKYQGAKVVQDSMARFDEELLVATQPYVDAINALPEDLKKYLTNDGDRQSAERGIATASQESVDENNARLTTIQAHTASIADNVNEMAQQIKEQRAISARTSQLIDDIRMNVYLMVKHLQGIETNTDNANSKLDKISSTLSDIQLKGIKMK